MASPLHFLGVVLKIFVAPNGSAPMPTLEIGVGIPFYDVYHGKTCSHMIFYTYELTLQDQRKL